MTRFFALVFAALVVSACSSQPKVPPPKLAIKSIALVPATNPLQYSLTNVSAVQFVIPLAATVNYADSKQKTQAFSRQLAAKSLNMAATLTEATAAALRGQGYEVQVLDQVERLKDSPDNVDYSKLVTTADAVLHVAFGEVGLHSPRSSTNYLPQINAYGIVSIKGRNDYLYDDSVYFGVDAKEGKASSIMADTSFAYPSFEVVMSSLDDVQVRFENASAALGQLLASQVHLVIKRQSPPLVKRPSAATTAEKP